VTGDGRHLSELTDGVVTVCVASLSPSPFGWSGTWLQFRRPTGEVSEKFCHADPGIAPQFRSLDLSLGNGNR